MSKEQLALAVGTILMSLFFFFFILQIFLMVALFQLFFKINIYLVQNSIYIQVSCFSQP